MCKKETKQKKGLYDNTNNNNIRVFFRWLRTHGF